MEGDGFIEAAKQMVAEDEMRKNDPEKWKKYCRNEIWVDGTPRNWNPLIIELKAESE